MTVIPPHYIISLSQSEVMSCPKFWMWLESWDWTASVLTNGETSLSSACCWVNIWSRFYPLRRPPSCSALAAKTSAAKLTSTCKRSISSTIAQDCQELLRCLFNFILNHFSVCQRSHLSMRPKEETWWTSSSCPSSEETQQVRWRFTDVSGFIWRFWSSWRWFHCVCCLSDAGCVSTANNSAEWLQKNFGPFSQFVSLTDLLSINGLFNPVCLHIFTCDFIKGDCQNNTNNTLPFTDILLFFCVSLVGESGQSHSKAGGWTDGW